MADWLLYSKAPDWKTEQEYRYVIVDQTDDPICVPVESCLTTAVLGARFPEWQIEGAKSMGASHNVRICRGEWHVFGLGLTDA